ncbi:MAG: TonB-dependent receptor [Tannerellaceae bacterium]
MKLSFFIMFVCVCQLFAVNSEAQNAVIKLSSKTLSIGELFNEIEKQTDYLVVYSNSEVDTRQQLTFKKTNAKVSDYLAEVTSEGDLKYELTNNYIILSNSTKAQILQQKGKTITGTISDANGEPIIGVNVVEKGSRANGTITDLDGKYTITVAPNSTLAISYIGYTPQDIAVGNKSVIDIRLQEDTQNLEEVVVVGYGVQKKTTLTGAISQMKTEELQSVPATNMSQLVTGRVAGVTTVQGSGEPGKDQAEIRIRGGKGALIVVDGVIGRDFNSLNPNDIENVTVLKDATATAVYGARAQNGVILVTTKRGRSEKIVLNYSGMVGLQQPNRTFDFLDVKEMSMRSNELNTAWGIPSTWNQAYYDKIGTDPDGTSDQVIHGKNWGNVNPYDQLVKDNTFQQQHSLSLTGGNKQLSYFASMGYLDQDAVYKIGGYGFERYSIRANMDAKFLNDNLKVSVDMFGQFEDGKYPSAGSWGVYFALLEGYHSRPLQFSDGRYTSQGGIDNVQAMLDPNHGYTNEDRKKFNTKVQLEYSIPGVKGLVVKAMGAYDYGNYFEKKWNVFLPLYDYFEDENSNIFRKPDLNEKNKFSTDTNIEAHIQYNNTFGDHEVGGLIVYSQNFYREHEFNAYKKDFVSSALDDLFMGETEGQSNSGKTFESARQGLVGRFTYGFKSRYLLEANFRYDASMNFPKKDRWGLFPSVAAGWRVSEEPFFRKLIPASIISNLKLRASFGITGNDVIIDPTDPSGERKIYFPFLATYAINSNRYIFGEGLTPVKGTSESRIPSYDITWEKTKSFNVGADIGLFDNTLTAEVDAFYYRTTGILLSREGKSATLMGQIYPPENIGIKRRGGVEFALNYRGKINDFKYNVGGTMTYYTSFWEYKDENEGNSMIKDWRDTYRNPSYGKLWGSEGLYQSFDEVMDHPRNPTYSTIEQGWVKYEDRNGDGKINEYDKYKQGRSRNPQLQYGITLGGEWKGFGLKMLFNGATMVDRMLSGQMRAGYYGMPKLKNQQDVWTPDNRDALYPRVSDYRSGSNNENSAFWLINASYLRMKNIELSYDFTHKLIKNKNIGALRVFLSGNNLFTITKVPRTIDPEASDENGTSYPLMRVYSLGLNLTF